jgi:hypothetical protein
VYRHIPDTLCLRPLKVDECAGALIRALSRAEEDLAPCLPPKKRAYLFGSLGFAAARTIMWLLPELGVRAPFTAHPCQYIPLQ